jgi:hypothetical protein
MMKQLLKKLYYWFTWEDEHSVLLRDREHMKELMQDREADNICLRPAWAEINRRIRAIEDGRAAEAEQNSKYASRAASKLIQKYKYQGD